MADGKPFSDEDLEGLRNGDFAATKTFGGELVQEWINRFLANLEQEYLEQIKLQRELAADRQRIEELGELKKDAHIQLKERSAKIVGLKVLLVRRDKTITTQATTIERLKKDAEIKDSLAKGVMALAEVYEQLEDAKKEIERLRSALEPFAPPYDIRDSDCYGIFLGGLIKRNFVDARQALDQRSE